MNEKVPKKSWREKRNIFYVALIVIFVVLLGVVILLLKLRGYYKENVCLTEECTNCSLFFLDMIDPLNDPCENFYNFSCGSYNGNSTLRGAQDLVNKIIKSYITAPTNKDDSRSVKLQKKYYQACMNVKAIEEDGNKSLKNLINKLGGCPLLKRDWNETEFDWGRIVENCIEFGLYYDWFLYIDNEVSYNQSNENLLIKPPDVVNKITYDLKESYILLMTNVFYTLGARERISPLSTRIRKVVNFENEIFQIIEESKVNLVKQVCTVDSLKTEFAFVPWSSIFKNVIWANNSKIISTVHGYLPKLEKLLNTTSKSTRANYIFWKLIESVHAFLPFNIQREFEIFEYQRGNHIPKKRSDYCYGVTNTVFSYASEAEYARSYASEKEPVRRIIDNVKEVLNDHIEHSKWINQTHKTYAYLKLRNMKFVVGGPPEMYDQQKFDNILGLNEIDILHLNSTLDIVRAVDKSRDAYNLNLKRAKISIERTKFYHGVGSLHTIKYLADENLMFLPAAALVDLIFSADRPQYLNYGALGTIIGHELVHGFGIIDSVQYEFGNKRINWSNSTFIDFFSAAECLLNQCNEIGDHKYANVSCQKTFEENFADYTGVNLAYEAYKRLEIQQEHRLPGLAYNSYQLFWISYASTMCYNGDYNATENLTHMLPYLRIMSSFRNSEYFAKDFNCPLGSNMNPERKCKIL